MAIDPRAGARVGLRVDVDTFRGTRDGVPRLLDVLDAHGLHATFFFTVGPDNMGRHLRRLVHPAFLWKMLRSQAASLYGWDILLRGTLWPGPEIGRHLADIIRRTADRGHEIGYHAWDHHAWQTGLDRMDDRTITISIAEGVGALTRILGRAPECSAVAGWKCDERVLRAKSAFGFIYNSDCRGREIFAPVVDGVRCAPQIPVTLPTYDELAGTAGVTAATYNTRLLALVRADVLNVLTVHAEVEGIACAPLFDAFLREARAADVSFVPLRRLLPPSTTIRAGAICRGAIAGREGWVCLGDVAADSKVAGAPPPPPG
jgi:undecaprenyl phosphate-alpha-L-ara4FN deformylase